MDQPGIGIVGCGRIVELVHAGVLKRLGARVRAVADPDDESRHRIASGFPDAAALTSATELLARDDVDAVLICVPNHLHAETARAAFAAEKHVYLEKPIAHDVASARTVVDAWERSGRVGMIGFNYRFHPACVAARAALREGRIGELIAIRTVFTTKPRQLPGWKRERVTGGGALLDYGSHHVDLVQFLTGRHVRDAAVRVRSIRTEHDTAALTLTLDGGSSVQSLFSASGIDEDRVELYGDRGKLSIERMKSLVPEISPSRSHGRGSRIWNVVRELPGRLVRAGRSHTPEPSFATAIGEYIDAVRAGTRPSPDLQDGLACLEVLAAAERSIDAGAAVAVNADGA